MPTWGEILKEAGAYAEKEGKPPFDFLRRKYLKLLADYTKRNTILYATAWTQSRDVPPAFLQITFEDMQGFMEVVHGLTGDNLDIIVHSPGGLIEATEALLIYLRTKFKNIRIIIPHAAMSAGTVLACGADEIVMGTHSFIGPIDPQMTIRTRGGQQQSVPAQAITEQFEMAKEQCKSDQKNISVWLPIIEQYGPALLKQCEHASELSQELVAEWLKTYMLAGDPEAVQKADRIASTLANHLNFKSHARHIPIQKAREMGLKVTSLEDDQTLQDLVLSVFHATTQTFDGSGAVKIVENQNGAAFIKFVGRVVLQQGPPPATAPPTPPPCAQPEHMPPQTNAPDQTLPAPTPIPSSQPETPSPSTPIPSNQEPAKI